jgi:nicotinamidase-related amidase
MDSAIVLIDIQNEYFKGGKRELCAPDEAAKKAARALDGFRSKGLPVFHVRHVNADAGAGSFLPGSPGAQIHESVRPLAGETVIEKQYPNAFLRTGLYDGLKSKGINHIAVCGMMSHMCVDTSVRVAQDYGLSVTVLEDACTTRDLSWGGETIPARTVHNAVMASLNGTFARVVKTEEFLADMG